MGKKTTTSFIHLIVNGSKCSTLKERISSKKEMIMANFYRGVKCPPENKEEIVLQSNFTYRGVNYNDYIKIPYISLNGKKHYREKTIWDKYYR